MTKDSWLSNTASWLSNNVFGETRQIGVLGSSGRDDGQSDKEQPKAKRSKREVPTGEVNANTLAIKEKGSGEKRTISLQHSVRESPGKSSHKNKKAHSATRNSKPSRAMKSSSKTSSITPPINTTPADPYEEFVQPNFVTDGPFIFSGGCIWNFVPDVIDRSCGVNGKRSITTRGCSYMTQGQLPEMTRFVLIQGDHPLFPQMTSFYSIGVVLANEAGCTIVDFLKIGNLGDLQEDTRNVLVRSGLSSKTILAEMWSVASGSLELKTELDANQLNEDEFVNEGSMVFHGNYGWSYSKGPRCWVLTSLLSQTRKRHVVVIGHPFSLAPGDYAIGVVSKIGTHMSLVEFRMMGVITALSPPTVAELVGRVENTTLSQRDIWRHATLPLI